MPVFITPPIAKREMDCRAARESASVMVSCTNTGTAYAQIREISLKRGADVLAKFEGGVYILPGASKSIGIKPEQTISTGSVALQVSFDDGKSKEFTVSLP